MKNVHKLLNNHQVIFTLLLIFIFSITFAGIGCKGCGKETKEKVSTQQQQPSPNKETIVNFKKTIGPDNIKTRDKLLGQWQLIKISDTDVTVDNIKVLFENERLSCRSLKLELSGQYYISGQNLFLSIDGKNANDIVNCTINKIDENNLVLVEQDDKQMYTFLRNQ